MSTDETQSGIAEQVTAQAEVPAEWRHIFAADCAPKRFKVPHHEDQYVEVGALTASQLEEITGKGWQLKIQDGTDKDGAASQSMDATIGSDETYILACKYAIKGFRFVDGAGKVWEHLPGLHNMAQNVERYKSLSPTLGRWVKEKIGEMNPELNWAKSPFVPASTSTPESA